MSFERNSIAARVAITFLVTGCLTLAGLALGARYFSDQFSQLAVAGILQGAAEDISQALEVREGGIRIAFTSIEAWGYDALYENIGYRLSDSASSEVILRSGAGREGAIVDFLPPRLEARQVTEVSDGLVAYRLPASVGGRDVFIDVARSDRLGELAREAVVPAITEAVFASILLATLVFSLALVLVTRRVSRSIRDMATSLVEAAHGTGDFDAGVARAPAELEPLVSAFRSAVSGMRDAYDAQKRFTENAAHELRTPLTVARITVERLEGVREREREELLKSIDVTADMVERLLELSRAQQTSSYRSETLRMSEVLETVREILRPIAEERGVTLAVEVVAGDLRFVGDRTAWVVAIKNIVENALKHAAGISSVLMAVSGESVRIENDGSSIDPAHRPHLFERFFRGDASRLAGGGLGLSIVEEVVRSSGGTIRYSDRDPSGSVFTICLPGAAPR